MLHKKMVLVFCFLSLSFFLLLSPASGLRVNIPFDSAKVAYGGALDLAVNVSPTDRAADVRWEIVEGESTSNGYISDGWPPPKKIYFAPEPPRIIPLTGTTRRITVRAVVDSESDTATIIIGLKPNVTFTAAPTEVSAGGSSTLRWNVGRATTVLMRKNSDRPTTVAASGTRMVTVPRTTNYTIISRNDFGEEIQTLRLDVTPLAVARLSLAPLTVMAPKPDLVIQELSPSTGFRSRGDGKLYYILNLVIKNNGTAGFSSRLTVNASARNRATGATIDRGVFFPDSGADLPAIATLTSGSTRNFEIKGPEYKTDLEGFTGGTYWVWPSGTSWDLEVGLTTDVAGEPTTNNSRTGTLIFR